MPFFSDSDKDAFAEFDNCTIEVFSEGTATKNARGALVQGEPITVLASQRAQEWNLTASEQVGLTGEEIRLRKKLRLHDYHEAITEKMFVLVDGIRHNILLAGHDGSKSCSILDLRRTTG